MAISLKTERSKDSIVVILGKDRPQKLATGAPTKTRSTVEVACIGEAIDRLSDFTTDSWPDVMFVRDGSANMLPLMAEVCRTAGVRLVSE
jgi:hypothetical protein